MLGSLHCWELRCIKTTDNHYKQINGVAMGTKMRPSYANLFVGFIENIFFSNYHGPKPDLHKRFIVGATSSSKEKLDQFITAVNSFHPALKYTLKISENSLAFLNNKLSINCNSLSTSVHYKPTDSHNYLLHSFCKEPITSSKFRKYQIVGRIFAEFVWNCALLG